MSHTRINSKWVKDLNVRLETIKVLEENIGSKISGSSHSNIFLVCLLRQGKQRKNKNMRLRQTRMINTAKEIINKIQNNAGCGGTYLPIAPDKGLISKMYKELKKLNTRTKQPN